MTSAVKAWGTTVAFDGVTIGELTSVSGSRTRNTIDVFTCDSADEAVEILTSGIDEGTVTMGFIHQPGAAENYDVLNDKYLQGRKGSLVITQPAPAGASAPTLTGQAIITSLDVPGFGSPREVYAFNVSFRISGKFTYKDSSGATTSSSPSSSTSKSASPSASAS
jgi:hypothetical protein